MTLKHIQNNACRTFFNKEFLPLMSSGSNLSSSSALMGKDSYMIGKKVDSRKLIANVDKNALDKEEILSIDSIANITEDEDGFQVYPDIDTPDQLFNGVPFKDLPYVLLVLHKNNTKLHALHADKRPIWNTCPSKHGFKNAKKRTNIAGQVAGNIFHQKLCCKVFFSKV